MKSHTTSVIVLAIFLGLFATGWLHNPSPRLAMGDPAQEAITKRDQQVQILDLIWEMESNKVRWTNAEGSSGEVGPYQITRNYFLDARDYDETLLRYRYIDLYDHEVARLFVVAYMQRWVPEAWEGADMQRILRTHNGGPRGGLRQSTLPYWTKAQGLLQG